MIRLVRVTAIAAVCVAMLSACSGGPDELTGMSPAWTGEVEQGLVDLPTAALTGDTVVLKTRDGVRTASREGGAEWSYQPFDDLRVDPDIALGSVPETKVYDNSMVVSGPEVGVNILPIGAGEPLFREASRDASAVALTESIVTMSCTGETCELIGRDVNDGTEEWTKEFEGTDPTFVPVDGGPQAIRSQRVDLRHGGLAPAEHDVVLVRSHRNSSEVMSIDIRTGEILAEFELSADANFNQFVAPDTVLQWDAPDENCEFAIRGLSARTGQVTWDEKFLFSADESMQFPESCAEVMHGPRLSDDMLLAATSDGNPIVVDYSSGEAIWQGEDPTQLALGYQNGLVLTAQRNDEVDKLIATDAASGDESWSINVERALTGTWPELGLTSDVLAFNSSNGDAQSVTAVSLADGNGLTIPETSYLVSVGADWVFTLDSLDGNKTRTLSMFTIG